jgi:ectoine hydroxylase
MLLTKKQKSFWSRNGYLHLQGILPKEYVAELLKAIDALHKKYEVIDSDKPFQIGLDRKFIVADDPTFKDLIDCKYSFPYILEIMGPCIQLCMSHALIRPAKNDFEGFVHTDGGQSMQSVYIDTKGKPLQIKIQYFLTDVNLKFSGNFIYKPGSHKIPFPVYDKDRHQKTNNMRQLLAKAGDVAIFTNALWHGATKNVSNKDRRSLIYGYNQMFLRPYDYHVAPENLLKTCTKRQRRLLGDLGTPKPQAHYYAPQDQVTIMEGVDDILDK